MEHKWICNKCGYETQTMPTHKNATCINCGKGRLKIYTQCDCGKWFHPERYGAKFCSKECAYKYKSFGGKKGKHYPNSQRARTVICPVCGKEFRAVHDYKGRKAVYCSKECWSNRGSHKRKIVRTPEFIKWKKEVFLRDNHTCQICGSKTHLEAHHIKEKRNYPKLQYDVENGICLCHECHIKTDNYGYKAINKNA